LKKRTFILITLAFVMFTHIMDSMIMMPLGDVFMSTFDLTPKQFTLLVGAYALGAFFSNIAGIFILDLFDRKKALLIIYGGFLIGTLACGWCNSYHSLLTVRFLTGIFGGLNGALVFSIVSDIFPYKERGKAMGIIMGGFSAAAALGVPLGLLVTYKFVWTYAFFFIALIGLPIYLFVLFGFPPIVKHMETKSGNTSIQKFTSIIKDKNQVYGLLFGCLLIFGHMMIIPFIAPYMTRNIGFTDMQLVLMYSIGGTLTVFTSPFFGKLVDRFGALKFYTIILIASFIPTLWVTHLATDSIYIALFVTSLFFIFGSGRVIAPQAMISGVITSETRGSFMSFKASIQQLAIFLAAGISGFIVKEAPNGTFIHYNTLGIISVAILLSTLLVAGRLRVVKGN
jgi:DHA1 family inner membrane transport protein